MRLFPRDEKFFDLLEEQANRIVEASRLLNEGVRSDRLTLNRMAGEIKPIEHEADQITHQLFTRLNQTFVTPLDPEDLHSLGASLDDVLDYIEDAAFRLSAYRIDPVPPGVSALTSIIHSCALRLGTAVGKLRTNGNTLEDCIEINRLENTADEVVRKRGATEIFSVHYKTNPFGADQATPHPPLSLPSSPLAQRIHIRRRTVAQPRIELRHIL